MSDQDSLRDRIENTLAQAGALGNDMQKLQIQFRGNLSRHNRDRVARPAHDHPHELFAGVDRFRETTSKPSVDIAIDVFRAGTSDSNRVRIVLVRWFPAKINVIADFQPCGRVVLPPANVQVEDPKSCQGKVARGGVLSGLFTDEPVLAFPSFDSKGKTPAFVADQLRIGFLLRQPSLARGCSVSDRARAEILWRRIDRRRLVCSRRQNLCKQPASERNHQKDADYYPHEETSVSTVSRTVAEVARKWEKQ